MKKQSTKLLVCNYYYHFHAFHLEWVIQVGNISFQSSLLCSILTPGSSVITCQKHQNSFFMTYPDPCMYLADFDVQNLFLPVTDILDRYSEVMLRISGPSKNRPHVSVIELPPVEVNCAHGPFQQQGQACLGTVKIGGGRLFEVQQRKGEILLGGVAFITSLLRQQTVDKGLCQDTEDLK